MSGRSAFMRLWGAPIVLGLLTAFGLLAALLGTGWWHWAAWFSLAIPIAVSLRYWLAPRQ
ncbi:hypothetical protein [Pollutimonas bauzanensis]|uniref:Uncharacterized protein n=1 Tax=Pollutimonas bauzanensis TaxID=658167 RepID=A0A1M5T9A0_9BURK|nr:hypothetical protein [Pollutimonas bauzanensis]SHH47278.1 hypothetical protein SAMN04488135_103305 [Pollutimonas bauzanensis]